MNEIHKIGYIQFDDHKEDIIWHKQVEGAERIYTVVTAEGFYIFDSDEDYDVKTLYKQVITAGSIPHSIKSECLPVKFKHIILYR